MSTMEGISTRRRDSKKSSELRYLRNELNRLKTYLAVHEYDLGLPEQKTESVSRRARKKTQRAKRERQRGRIAQYVRERTGRRSGLPYGVREEIGSRIDRKLASYRNRIKKTSIQLVMAAAAGDQYREEKLAAREDGTFDSDESDVSDSSNSYIGDSDTDITDFSGSEIDLPSTGIPAAMAAQIESLPGPGDWADKLTQPVIAKYARKGPPKAYAKPYPTPYIKEEEDEDLRLPHKPASPQPELYDTKQWRDINIKNNLDTIKPDPRYIRTDKFPGETGLMTWELQEKTYPTLDSILEMGEEYGRWDPGYLDLEKPDPRLWDPDQKEQIENKPAAVRLPLEANITTKVSLERIRAGFERAEMNTDYTPYSQIPAILPEKLSDEVMMRGPLPTPPRLPLKGPSGRVIAPESKTNTPAQPVHPDPYLKTSQDSKDLPTALLAQYHYPVDSPATSTFKLGKDRSTVPDVVKPASAYKPIPVHKQAPTRKVEEEKYMGLTAAEYKERFQNLMADVDVHFPTQPQETQVKREEVPEQQPEYQKQKQENYQQILPDIDIVAPPPPSSATLPMPTPFDLPLLPFQDPQTPASLLTPFDLPFTTAQQPQTPAPRPPPSASASAFGANDPWWHYTSSDVDTMLYPPLNSTSGSSNTTTTATTTTAPAPAPATATTEPTTASHWPPPPPPTFIPPRGPPSPLDLSAPAAAAAAHNNEEEDEQLQAQILSEIEAAATTPADKEAIPSPFPLPLRSTLPRKGVKSGGVLKDRRKKKKKQNGHVRFGGTETLTFAKDK
ncbi:hypothetical protein F4774DRAFT_406626 [Daldinia eschscholtzii]|nr:hypothetical protein F4774DRAFT_406626 [Daldinia eschscholtzii]